LKLYFIKPKKGKKDGSISLMHLSDEQFFALLDEIKDTIEYLEMFKEK